MSKIDNLKLRQIEALNLVQLSSSGSGSSQGSGSGSGSGKTYEIKQGTCGAYIPMSNGDGSGIGLYSPSVGSYSDGFVTGTAGSITVTSSSTLWQGIDKESAIGMSAGISGAKWCCDNCDKASWYQ